jgi:thiol-disulfide isomerase/thioredoxin
MRIRLSLVLVALLLLLGLGSGSVCGQSGPLPAGIDQATLQKLFDPELTVDELGAALEQAAKGGVKEQILLEAQLIWGLRRGQTAFLTTLLPELEALVRTFDPRQSAGIRSLEEIRGLVTYVKALVARDRGDDKAFEELIKEAFWLHPASAPLFAQTVEAVRREKKMATLRLDLEVVITTSEGEATTLRDQLNGQKALLLDFWATWCGPCMALMPELRKKASQLSQHGIVVVAMNTDSQNAEALADKVRREKDMTLPWLVEPDDRPYSNALEIRSIPSMVLVTPDGKVQFFGHPQSPDLWQALQKIDPSIQPPEA